MTHTTQHILIVGQDTVFGRAIQSMLSGQAPYQITWFTPESSVALLSKMEELQPDIVILISDTGERSTQWRTELLELHSHIYLVEISAKENAIEMFYKRHAPIKQANDLLSILQQIEVMQGLNGEEV